MNAFLIIITIVLAVLLLIVNFYLLVLYCHRTYIIYPIADDRGWGASLFCKILVILGMTLTWAQVLMLPLDAANARYHTMITLGV